MQKDIPSSSRVQVQAKTNGFHQKQKIVNEVQGIFLLYIVHFFALLNVGQCSHKIAAAMQAKKKAEALKDNRDYSFLLSDDADIPSPPREKPAARPSLTQKSGEFELLLRNFVFLV